MVLNDTVGFAGATGIQSILQNVDGLEAALGPPVAAPAAAPALAPVSDSPYTILPTCLIKRDGLCTCLVQYEMPAAVRICVKTAFTLPAITSQQAMHYLLATAM